MFPCAGLVPKSPFVLELVGDTFMAVLQGDEETFAVQKFKPVLVRPATGTNDGFYPLSNLDHTLTFLLASVFCFKADGKSSSESASEVIKQALAKVLVHYHPLAGRLIMSSDGKLMVKCTGEGVTFVEAVANRELEVLGDVAMLELLKLKKLIHTVDGARNILEIPLVTVQVTRFECGGFVIGVGVHHCIGDGKALLEFLNSWAEIARGLPLTVPPFLDRLSVLRSRKPRLIEFPHQEFAKSMNNTVTVHQEQQIVHRSFCLDPEKLTQLKRIAMEEGYLKSFTSFELLVAFVWRARTRALKMESHQQTKVHIVVDGRHTFGPSFPKGYFGNGIVLTCCMCSAGDLIEKPLSFAVKLVQVAINSVTKDYIRSAIDFLEVTRAIPSFENSFLISKWTRLPFYTLDFGWGGPIQVGSANFVDYFVFLQSQNKEGKNIILSLGLPTSAMMIFQELMRAKVMIRSNI